MKTTLAELEASTHTIEPGTLVIVRLPPRPRPSETMLRDLKAWWEEHFPKAVLLVIPAEYDPVEVLPPVGPLSPSVAVGLLSAPVEALDAEADAVYEQVRVDDCECSDEDVLGELELDDEAGTGT